MLQKENSHKEERVRRYLQEKGYEFVLLSRRANFAWLTCGGLNHISWFSEQGECAVLLGAGGERFVFASQIEAPRLDEEKIAALGYEVICYPWHDESGGADEIRKKTATGRVLSDRPGQGFDDLPEDFWRLRSRLLPEEVTRYRALGYDASEALLETARSVGPGFKEFEIESIMAASCLRRQIRPCVMLVAADERIDRFRHPLPREAPFEDRVMLVLCAERHGLIANLSRFLYRNSIPRALDRRHEAVARIDATAIAGSKPGRPLQEVFQRILDAYHKEGYGEEWENHHQGGPTGYLARDLLVTPRSEDPIQSPQALAWNPSLPGVKSEDTILVTDKGFEVLTRGDGWDLVSIDTEEGSVERPWPLVI